MAPRVKIVTSIAHHRNGSAGVPFYVVLFRGRPSPSAPLQNLMAIIPNTNDEHIDGLLPCFVLDVDLLAKGNVDFSTNSWRGDTFLPLLRPYIERWERSRE